MKRIDCTVPGHEGEWINRVDRVPKKFWDAWKKAGDEATQKLFSDFITDWHLTDVNGKELPQPKRDDLSVLDEMDVALLPWLVDAITKSVIEDMTLLPNKSSPLPTP